MSGYPRLEIDLQALRQNAETYVSLCASQGIEVTGVTKGFCGIPEIASVLLDAGCKSLSDSRLDDIARLRAAGIRHKICCIRIPMLSELASLIQLTDGSYHSEIQVIRALSKEASFQGRDHQVVLMMDLGDLREGFFAEEELLEAALEIERNMPRLQLSGIGVNLGCYGSVKPTVENLSRLCLLAEEVEKAIGRPLDVISGGSTSSLPLVVNGSIPRRINHLRLGEALTTNKDMEDFWRLALPNTRRDSFQLWAELIELKDKPTYPVGELTFDYFGNSASYVDRGIRRRALAALGKKDIGDIQYLVPRDEGVSIVGCSSDHLILDVEDSPRKWNVGDRLCFDVMYGAMLFSASSPSVWKHFCT